MNFTVLIVIATISLSLFHASDRLSAEIYNEKNMFSIDDIRLRNTNPHFTGKYCDECHARIPEKGQDTYLRFEGNFNRLCSCHDYGTGKYTHPVGISPSEEKKAKMPAEFPLKNGVISCDTCHDIYLQCQRSQFSPSNAKFLRGGPYTKRTAICFKCHDENKYKKHNPHKQLNAAGNIIEEACLYCHAKKPDEKEATYETIKLIGDIKMVCQRCHNIQSRHPAGKEHFIKPDNQILNKMKTAEIIYNIILPLDNEQRITCITCHNPHERGVIPKERESAKGAGEIYGHRLATTLICNACHDFYGM